MESIGNFFGKMLDRIINRLSYQIRSKITNVANSKIRDAVENPFNQNAKNNQQTKTNTQESNVEY